MNYCQWKDKSENIILSAQIEVKSTPDLLINYTMADYTNGSRL